MRPLICAGGTGGGVYPALVVLERLLAEEPGMQALWVGGEGGMEAQLVERAHVPFQSIPAAGVHGVGLRQLPGNLARLAKGTLRARRILKQFKPDVLFFTGGYVAVPMALAGLHIPSLLYVPDIEPGMALRVLAAFARKIAVTAEASRQYFRRAQRITVTGYPVRAEFSQLTRQEARRQLGIATESPVVLFVGGSKGALSINNAILANLPALLDLAEIIHITGERDWEMVTGKPAVLSPAQQARWHVYPYLHEQQMGAAFAAADLVVSRAGASVLGELPLFGLPAILVPYPHAWRYQKVNAQHLAANGAARLLADADLAMSLPAIVGETLADQPALARMSAAMRSLARPQAASAISALLRSLASERR